MSVAQQPRVHTMLALGRMGRFGNQVFQYAFLRLVARASGTTVQTPPWIGQTLFGHDDPPVTVSLRRLVEKGSNLEAFLDAVPEFMPFIASISDTPPARIGKDAMKLGAEPADIVGFFQWHSSEYRPHADVFRSLFQPAEDLREWLDEPIDLMRKRGKTIVAIHLRTGDYKWYPHMSMTLMLPPQRWVEWLDSIWHELDEPVLFLCSNDVSRVRHWFAKFNPVTADDLTVAMPARLKGKGAGFYLDYYVMTQADVLGISNSSFSFSAAMLNERGTKFVRATWDLSKGPEEFDPWNDEVLRFLPGGKNKIEMRYGQMLSIAYHRGGLSNAIATVLLYHPVGQLIVLGIRLQIRLNHASIVTRRFLRGGWRSRLRMPRLS